MDREQIESRLRLYIANVALAAVGKKEGNLREAKDALIDEVGRIANDSAKSPCENSKFATKADILAVHAQFGQIERAATKKAMGPNWPKEWDNIRPGVGIFKD